MLSADEAGILLADCTRCEAISNFLKVGHLCVVMQLSIWSHCAPSKNLHASLAISSFYIAEYFFDQARIEELLFDGFITQKMFI